PYYSLEDGAAEARHVFLEGNDLPQRFRDGFSIAELGFGTGLNLLVTLAAWGDRAGRFRYTSFEAFPLSAEDHRRALARWPDLAQLAAGLCGHIAASRTVFSLGPADVSLITGDARETLVDWNGTVEAWYLDGFSPARNPELWEPALMAQIARHTAPGGSFATYSAAGDVRRALGEAGFAVARREGFGRKRHMSVGRLR
ncbi:MAG: tRNA (5-methylaminomethyl-2-thiouridine)(34)-methyltransferase MnmD, partial [Pseudomonadota bacterium]